MMVAEQLLQHVTGRFATNPQFAIQIRKLSERHGRAAIRRRHPACYQSTHLGVQYPERVQVNVVDRAA
jgi:hypothetical protein